MPTEKYVYRFSPKIELYFQSFDDEIIQICQKYNIKTELNSDGKKLIASFFKWLALTISCTFSTVKIFSKYIIVGTSIENGPSFVIFLSTIGLDYMSVINHIIILSLNIFFN